MTEPDESSPVADTAEAHPAIPVLLELARETGPDTTFSPMDAAQRLAPGDNWQRALPQVRRAAVELALQGRLVIYRKGKPVDPREFRGVYRLGLPRDE